MPVLTFAAYRLWAGVLIFAVMFAVTGRRLTLATLRTCALGGVLFTADVACSFLAFKLTSVADATIIGALAPVFIMIGAGRWFGEHVGRRDLVFVGFSLAGVALVTIGSVGIAGVQRLGRPLRVHQCLHVDRYWLVSKRARASVGALEYIASVMLVAAILMTMLALVSREGLVAADPTRWTGSGSGGWRWGRARSATCSSRGLTGHVEAWLGSLITQCMPIVSSVAAWVLLGEALTPLTIAGGLIVLAATAAILMRTRTPTADDTFEVAPESPAPAG